MEKNKKQYRIEFRIKEDLMKKIESFQTKYQEDNFSKVIRHLIFKSLHQRKFNTKTIFKKLIFYLMQHGQEIVHVKNNIEQLIIYENRILYETLVKEKLILDEIIKSIQIYQEENLKLIKKIIDQNR